MLRRPVLRRPVLPRTVLVSLLLGMLLVVGVTTGSMLVFSNLVVQRQVSRLPPELRDQFHEHIESGPTLPQQSLPGQTGTPPAARVAASTLSGGFSSAGLSSTSPGSTDSPFPDTVPGTQAVFGPLLPLPPGPRLNLRAPGNRARFFLRDVGESLKAAGLVSALFGLLLAVLMARRIARPISLVSEAAMRVAAGDLGARAPVLAGDRETTELARNFNVMAQEIQALEQERRDTVAAIAHELRTPLTVMQARLDAIEDGVYPLDQEQVLRLSDQTQLLTRLVADLRTLSLAEAGRLSLHLGPVSPLFLARAVAQDIQAAHAGQGVQAEVVIDGHGEDAGLFADQDRLRQVLINLTENAFKHARSCVRLTVQPRHAGEAAGRGLSLHVDDDGPGIPDADRERVFEQFVRLDVSRSRDKGGSGLGLAVVRALMQAHGGLVSLGGSPLGGTRVTLHFPPQGGVRTGEERGTPAPVFGHELIPLAPKG